MAKKEKEKKRVEFEVVVKPAAGYKSMFDEDAYPTADTVDRFRADKGMCIATANKLRNLGVEVTHVGEFSMSAACAADRFEELFGTKLSKIKPSSKARFPKGYRMLAPDKGAPWTLPSAEGLDTLIDRAYVQHPPIYFSDERPVPPFWTDQFRLRVPGDVAQIMNAAKVHRRGVTGEGVKVVMVDSGFYHHPYFTDQGYNFLAVTAPDTVDHTSDANGHGTGECANLFATAPGINFIGVKAGQNMALAIKTATELRPDIMSNSWGQSVDLPNTAMPNWLKPLHLAVLDAVARGITVCFSGGNGHFGFPGSMPEVISVGGVYVNEKLKYQASSYASCFDSTWFPGRHVPDVCGLVGPQPKADYIVLPVQSGAQLEIADGWGAFSGTSAAAPMVAGVCALLKQVDPSLGPADIKNILKFTARDVAKGKCAHQMSAQAGWDGATGFGLVDAGRALEALL